MRVAIAIVLIGLLAGARAQSTCPSGASTLTGQTNYNNCVSCSGTDASTAYCTICSAGYQLTAASATAGAARTCTNTCDSSCSFCAPKQTGAAATPANTVCMAGANTADGNAPTAPTTTATVSAKCNNNNATTATSTANIYFTGGAVAASGPAYTTANPAQTFTCYKCPTGCQNCDTKAATAATASPTGCNAALSNYYLSGTADATTGLFPTITACPTTVSATYGGNATSCSACNSVTNCTTGVCGTGYTYVSLGNTTNMGVQTIGGKTVNLTQVPYASSGPYQGCYNSDQLLAIIAAANAASNTTNTTTSASRVTAGIAVVSAVAAVFAF